MNKSYLPTNKGASEIHNDFHRVLEQLENEPLGLVENFSLLIDDYLGAMPRPDRRSAFAPKYKFVI